MPSTVERVPAHTDARSNRRIADQITDSVIWHAQHPEAINRRLAELDREWDIERVLEANASALAFVGVMLGIGRDRRWLALPALVSGFLFQHATQGWCPPLPILRRLGFRTAREIDIERVALKALRGDFAALPSGRRSKRVNPRSALRAARA